MDTETHAALVAGYLTDALNLAVTALSLVDVPQETTLQQLRALEDAHVHVILCRNFGDHGLGLAIRDRLLKAAGGKIIDV